jgi:hypothetical protein
MNFEKFICFDGENIPKSACYYTEDKSKLSADVNYVNYQPLIKLRVIK